MPNGLVLYQQFSEAEARYHHRINFLDIRRNVKCNWSYPFTIKKKNCINRIPKVPYHGIETHIHIIINQLPYFSI